MGRVTGEVLRRVDVFLVNLDPTIGYANQKTRPAVIIAPMTTKSLAYPTRIPCTFEGKEGWVVLDQIRTVDKARLVSKLGKLEKDAREGILAGLAAMFHE